MSGALDISQKAKKVQKEYGVATLASSSGVQMKKRGSLRDYCVMQCYHSLGKPVWVGVAVQSTLFLCKAHTDVLVFAPTHPAPLGPSPICFPRRSDPEG